MTVGSWSSGPKPQGCGVDWFSARMSDSLPIVVNSALMTLVGSPARSVELLLSDCSTQLLYWLVTTLNRLGDFPSILMKRNPPGLVVWFPKVDSVEMIPIAKRPPPLCAERQLRTSPEPDPWNTGLKFGSFGLPLTPAFPQSVVPFADELVATVAVSIARAPP